MASEILTQELLKTLFSYDMKTGDFVRIKSVAQQRAGFIAGSKNSKGYKRIRINGSYYYCHRLAFLYLYGEMPEGVVDHIDGNPSNNSINNLRCVSRSQNAQNLKQSHSDSKTKELGVWVHKQTGKYCSQITVKSKRISLGLFNSTQEAKNAYLKAKREIHECGTI